MPNQVKIKISFDSAQAVKGLNGLEKATSASLRGLAIDSKAAALATRDTAKAIELNAVAALSGAKANQLDAQTLLASARASKALAQTKEAEMRTRLLNEKAANAETLALEKQQRATTRENSLFAPRTKGQARHDLIETGSNSLLLGGGAALALSASNIQQAAGFDQALRNVSSLTKSTDAQFKAMHDDVLSLTKDPLIRQTPEDLAKGLYNVASSGYSGKEALDILRVSAIGAGAGMTDTSTATDLLTSVLKSNIPGVASARQAMDILFQEVDDGKNTFEQLAGSIGPVLPLAAQGGISLQQVSAAMAVLTLQGISAGQSAEYLNQFLQQMIKPGAESAKLMDSLGIKYGATHIQAVGLTGALEEIRAKTEGHKDSLAKLFPNIQSYIALLGLSQNGGKAYRDELDRMAHASDGLGAAQAAAAEQAKGAVAQSDKLKQKYETLAITTGEKLLPVAERLATDLGNMLDAFEKLPKPVQDATTDLIAYGGAAAVAAGGVGKLWLMAKNLKGLLGGAGLTTAEGAGGAVAAGGLLKLFGGGSGGGLLGGAGLAGLPARLGLTSGGLGYGGVSGLGGAGGNLLGGAVLAAPAMFAGFMANKIMGAQNDGYNAEQQGFGTNTDDLALRTSRVAKLRNEMKGLTAGTSEYKKVQHELAQEKFALSLMSGATQRGAAGVAPTSDLGMKIAREAYTKYQSGLSASYVHMCEGLAHDNYKAVGGAYEKILSGGGPRNSALKTLGRFQAAGLAQPYTPGMALPPGSLLYSSSMGKGSGHVQTIGPNGQRLDQYGTNHFNERNFQYYVPPPGLKVVRASRSGGSATAGPTDAQKSANQDIQDQLFEARHGEFENKRFEARNDFKKSMADPDVTDKAAARKLLAAKLKEINADEAADQKKHHESLEREQKAHEAKVKDEAEKAQKSHQAARVAAQQNLLTDTDAAIQAYERLLDKGIVTAEKPLRDAYKKRQSRQMDLAGMEYDSALADSPDDKAKLDAEKSGKIKAANAAYAEADRQLTEKGNAAKTQALDLEKQRLAAARTLLETQAQAARTDDEKTASQKALLDNALQTLLVQKKIDDLSPDVNTRAMSGTNYTVGVQAASVGDSQQSQDTQDAARDRRGQFLRAEAEAADTLTERIKLLAEAHSLEAVTASRAGNEEAVKTQALQAQKETNDLLLAQKQQSASQAVTGALLGKSPGERSAQSTAALSQYEALTRTGTLEQQQQAVSTYLSVLDNLFHAHVIGRQEALADLKRLTSEWESTGRLTPETARRTADLPRDLSPRNQVNIGGGEFWQNMAQEASQEGGNILHAMLHPKKGQSVEKQFFQELAGIGENALASVVSGSLQNAITGGLKGVSGKSLFSGVQELFQGAKGNLLAGAAGIYGAAMALGAGGKKKQKHSILGGLLGFAAGSLLPGIGNLEGAEFGSALGGMFAAGGLPPVGRPILVGEHGPEIVTLATAGRVLSHPDTMRALSGAVQPPALSLQMPGPPSLPRSVSASGGTTATGAGLHGVISELTRHIKDLPPGVVMNVDQKVDSQASADRSARSNGRALEGLLRRG